MADTTENTERVSAASRLAAKRAAKAAAKAARRGTDAVPTEAVARSWLRAGGWAETHRQPLLIAGALALLAAGGAVFLISQRGSREHGAGSALAKAIDAAHGRIVAAGETPPDDAIGESFPTAEARAKAALTRFRTLSASYPSANAASWALLGEANTSLDLGKADDARKAYARALELGRADPFVEGRALEGLGFSFEAQGKNDEAMRRFEELASARKGAYRASGDYHRARLYAAQGKGDKALEVLDALFEAEKTRAKAADAAPAPGVLDDARALSDELAVMLGKPKREISVGTDAASATQQHILDALRKQLAADPSGMPKPGADPP
jgi:tetratricopeptide (TPR) repeat protein